MSLTLASIHVYPVKSLGGFAVMEALVTDRGLEHDRRWMLVDPQGNFLTQREHAAMACLHTSVYGNGFRVTDRRDGGTLDLPWIMAAGEERMCGIWSDRVRTIRGEEPWSKWFSERLGASVELVYMPDRTKRHTDGRYAKGITSLSDGFPYLVLSQASLDDLNSRLDQPVPMDRFRPNLVVSGGVAYQEDGWTEMHVGELTFQLVKPCGRCLIVTTDQQSGERTKEPLRTMATYRSRGAKVLFGMNAMGPVHGTIRVGDHIQAIQPAASC